MKYMTAEQIAKTCGVQERTVQLWAKKAGENISSVAEKISSAGHGKPARFSLEETISIVRAAGRYTLAVLLEENAKKSSGDSRIDRFPNGVQLTELRRIFGPREAARRVDFAIGYSRDQALPSPDYAQEQFDKIKENLKQKKLDFRS